MMRVPLTIAGGNEKQIGAFPVALRKNSGPHRTNTEPAQTRALNPIRGDKPWRPVLSFNSLISGVWDRVVVRASGTDYIVLLQH